MPNVRFNLKNKTEQETLISLVFRYDGNKMVYSTGEKINPKYWNDREYKAREMSKFPQYAEFNAYLKKVETETQNIYRTHKNNGKILSIDEFKKELDIALQKTNRDAPPTLFEFIENFIYTRKNTLSKPKGSIVVYNNAYKHLKGFANDKKRKVNFEDITLEFLDEFLEYLFTPPRSLSSNYALKIIENLKLFLNDATERGYNTNLAYKSRKFGFKKEETENIYLTLEELKVIEELDLNNKPRLDRVRDLFLIGCYTGLRFSDFSSLKKEHFKKIDKVDVIEIVTQKTKEKVIIPMHPVVKNILKKYDGKIPPELSNQKMNDYLKELGELALLNDVVIKTYTKGGKRVDDKFKKFELISTHTARRSFATNAFKSGISSISIMKITGHNSEKSFLKYIKINQAENAVLMAKNDFFLN